MWNYAFELCGIQRNQQSIFQSKLLRWISDATFYVTANLHTVNISYNNLTEPSFSDLILTYSRPSNILDNPPEWPVATTFSSGVTFVDSTTSG